MEFEVNNIVLDSELPNAPYMRIVKILGEMVRCQYVANGEYKEVVISKEILIKVSPERVDEINHVAMTRSCSEKFLRENNYVIPTLSIN